MRSLYFLLILLFCVPVQARWFGGELIFKNPIAHPRSPTSGVLLETSRYISQRVFYIDASLGKEAPIYTNKLWDLDYQFSIEGGGWFTLGYEDGTFPLLTEDFLFAFPLSWRYGNFSGSFKWNHISAHLGDGMEGLLEDSLSKKERIQYETYKRIASDFDVDLTLTDPFSYSRDFVSSHLSYEYSLKHFKARTYVYGAYIYHIAPQKLRRHFFGAGYEVEAAGRGFLTPYGAYDVSYYADTDSVDFSVQLGFFISRDRSNNIVHPRIVLNGYVGSDRRGQLLGRRMKQFGVGLLL